MGPHPLPGRLVSNSVSISTIISDLGGVLLDFDNSIYERKLALSTGQSLQAVQTTLNDLLPDLHIGRLTPTQLHEALQARLGLTLSLPELATIYSDIFTPKADVVSLLRDLQPRYRLCLLSNTNEIHWEYCRARYPFLSIFEHHVLSHEVKSAKPEPAIYQQALRLLDVPPETCVYIDDIWVYADAATALGLHGLTFTSAAALEHDLSQLSIHR